MALAENDTPGVFNTAGPVSTTTRTGLMWGLLSTTTAKTEFYWPDAALLEEMDINLPMMGRGDKALFINTASIKAGLQYRSLADTAVGTLEWWQSQPAERRASPRRWPGADKEQAAIAKLKAL